MYNLFNWKQVAVLVIFFGILCTILGWVTNDAYHENNRGQTVIIRVVGKPLEPDKPLKPLEPLEPLPNNFFDSMSDPEDTPAMVPMPNGYLHKLEKELDESLEKQRTMKFIKDMLEVLNSIDTNNTEQLQFYNEWIDGQIRQFKREKAQRKQVLV